MKSRCSKSYEFRTLLTPHCLVLFGFLKTKEKKTCGYWKSILMTTELSFLPSWDIWLQNIFTTKAGTGPATRGATMRFQALVLGAAMASHYTSHFFYTCFKIHFSQTVSKIEIQKCNFLLCECWILCSSKFSATEGRPGALQHYLLCIHKRNKLCTYRFSFFTQKSWHDQFSI